MPVLHPKPLSSSTPVFDLAAQSWFLVVFGKTGCHINGVHHAGKSAPVPLKGKARIQAPGGHHFFFLGPVEKQVSNSPLSLLHTRHSLDRMVCHAWAFNSIVSRPCHGFRV